MSSAQVLHHFGYDANGNRVAERRSDGTLVFFIGEYFEYSVKGTETHTKKYYGREVLRVDDDLRYILTDHLGSTSIVTDANGENIIEQRYDAWGKTQFLSGSMLPTGKVQKWSFCLAEWHSVPFCTYTGQRHS